MDPFGIYVLLFFAAQSFGGWEQLWLFSTFHTRRKCDRTNLRVESPTPSMALLRSKAWPPMQADQAPKASLLDSAGRRLKLYAIGDHTEPIRRTAQLFSPQNFRKPDTRVLTDRGETHRGSGDN